MPQFGTHFTGPIRHAGQVKNQSTRAWFRGLPVGMNDPDFVHQFVDFLNVDDYNTNAYTLNSSGTGTSAAVNQTGNLNLGSTAMSVNGALLLKTGSTAGNYAEVQNKVLGWVLDRSVVANTHALGTAKPLWFEASFSADLSGSDVDCFVGLSESAASVVGPSAVSQNFVGFKIANGAATVAYVASTAGTVTSGTVSQGSGNSVSLALGTLTKVGFHYTGGNSVDFYINRNFMNTFTIGSLPTAALAPTIQIVTNAAINRSMIVDYLYISKAR